VDSYAITLGISDRTRRYRHGGQADFELAEAVNLAGELFERNRDAEHVTVGNAEHEFRLCAADAERHADWYVDAEVAGYRLRYRPMADLDGYDAADELAAALEQMDEVRRIWMGASDGSEDYETDRADA
jgi:hypothetical protein